MFNFIFSSNSSKLLFFILFFGSVSLSRSRRYRAIFIHLINLNLYGRLVLVLFLPLFLFLQLFLNLEYFKVIISIIAFIIFVSYAY